jgi:Uma2 family endonuclease
MTPESTVTPTVEVVAPATESPPAKRAWPPEQGQWTYEDWLRLPDDGFRYEVLNGELHMTPPPTIAHQNVVTKLAARMHNFAEQASKGIVLVFPVGVQLPGQPVPVQPDIVFVRADRRDIIGEDYVEGAPDLVVEVLSPSNWLYDRREKLLAYQQAGVPEYWIIDYRARTVEIRVLEEGKYALLEEFSSGEMTRSQALPGFEIPVDDLFEM